MSRRAGRADRTGVFREPRDIVDIEGVAGGGARGPGGGAAGDEAAGGGSDEGGAGKNWLGIWFKCCHVYSRIYRNAEGTRYEGRCPRCGAAVKAMVGPGGSSQRIFAAE